MVSQRQLFLSYLAQTSEAPLMLEIERAEGVYLIDVSGKKYLDLISGIGVSNVGHCHPQVVNAVKRQVEKYMHLMVYGELIQSPQISLAQKLSETLPENLHNVYFVNSGTEAIEGAMKLAKRFTGRFEIISCYNSYHGSSQGALSLNGTHFFKQAYRPLLPGVKHISFNEPKDLDQITSKTAAVIIETIQGEAGVQVPNKDYFKALEKRCKENNCLLIVDEIQSGFGRTGKFWAFEHFGITPDVLVCAKGMGGGMPIGAFISSKEIMNVFTNNPFLGHITTFGGHPVSCAASIATIDILQKERLIEQVSLKEKLFKELLVHKAIKSIRSKGLMMAVEFESFDVLKKVIDKAIELGVLTDWFLYCNNSMRIAPPLTISEVEIKYACSLIIQAIDETL